MVDYSQSGEQKKLIDLFDRIGNSYKYAVDIGAGDGEELSNTKHFLDNGWKVLMFDKYHENEFVKKKFITAENVNDILDEYSVPKYFDLLSIDIDGNDYWVWNAINRQPLVVIIEYNPSITESKTIKYNPDFIFNHTNYFGASFYALKKLGIKKGYNLYDCTTTNLIFISKEITIKYDEVIYKHHKGWPTDKNRKEWVKV